MSAPLGTILTLTRKKEQMSTKLKAIPTEAGRFYPTSRQAQEAVDALPAVRSLIPGNWSSSLGLSLTRELHASGLIVPSITTVIAKALAGDIKAAQADANPEPWLALVKRANAHKKAHRAAQGTQGVTGALSGTTVHAAIDARLRGLEAPYFNSIQELGYFGRWEAWANSEQLKPMLTEETLSNSIYGATLDFYGVVGSTRTVLDWKTGKTWATGAGLLQTYAQAALLKELGHTPEFAGICHLSTNGSPGVFTYELSEWGEALAGRLSATVTAYLKRYELG